MSAANGVILALNGGSSSLKVGCFQRRGDVEESILTGSANGIGRPDGSLQLKSADGALLLDQQHTSETESQALERLLDALQPHLPAPLTAIAHRVVHGGPHLREHTLITPDVITELEASVHLAPLHIPPALEMIRTTQKLFPNLPEVACLDDAFHRTLPAVAAHLPIPEPLFAKGVQRYGFHGLSCESVMRRLGPEPPARLVIAHLGSGSSLTAVRQGESIDTTMGLSPSGGIPMSTRTGDLDPAVLVYLVRSDHMDADALEQFINHQGGLAALSGGESDMQVLLQREDHGDDAAALAVNAFCTAVRKTIGSYAALLGGLDRLVFTGGIGEHSAAVRDRIVNGLDFLLASPMQQSVAVLPAQEELEMAYNARALCG